MSIDGHFPTTPIARPDVTDTAVSGYLFVFLRLYAQEAIQEDALRALPYADWMLEPPPEHERVHPCPLGARPASGETSRHGSVCKGDFKQRKQQGLSLSLR